MLNIDKNDLWNDEFMVKMFDKEFLSMQQEMTIILLTISTNFNLLLLQFKA